MLMVAGELGSYIFVPIFWRGKWGWISAGKCLVRLCVGVLGGEESRGGGGSKTFDDSNVIT